MVQGAQEDRGCDGFRGLHLWYAQLEISEKELGIRSEPHT